MINALEPQRSRTGGRIEKEVDKRCREPEREAEIIMVSGSQFRNGRRNPEHGNGHI
jgi:hypothetical protein